MSKGCCFTLEFDCCLTATTLLWSDISCVKCRMSLVSWSLLSFQMSIFPRVMFETSLFSASCSHFREPTGALPPLTLSCDISPHCTVQQPAPPSLQIWLKWLSWFPWKPGAQRSGKIHFTLQQRDKEMVRQRESGREEGLKRESGGKKGSLTLKDASFV